MRRGSLSDGGHDKITWKQIRDLLTSRCENAILRSGGIVPQRRYWVFHLRLTGDVMDTYHWDVLATCQRDVVVCFIWNLLETSWRRTDETLLLRLLETSSRRSNKMSWRRTTRRFNDVPSRRLWVFHLRGTGDVAGTYREMSLRRRHNGLLPGGKMLHFLKNTLFELNS